MDDTEYELTQAELREARLRGQRDESRRAFERSAMLGTVGREKARSAKGGSDRTFGVIVSLTVATAVLFFSIRSCQTQPRKTTDINVRFKAVPSTVQSVVPASQSCLHPEELPWPPLEWRGPSGRELADKAAEFLRACGLNPIDADEIHGVLLDLVREPWRKGEKLRIPKDEAGTASIVPTP